MNYPTISVIVPVYNAAKFLERCVNSLIEQTYPNMEIILIDDGSTDGSSEICDELSNNSNKIVVIHKENGGVSSARNAGLKIAKGEYIGFCDADDYCRSEMFERMYNDIIETDADIVHVDYAGMWEDALNLSFEQTEGSVQVKNRKEGIKWIFTSKFHRAYAWSMLFKRPVVENLSFPEDMAVGEDKFFVVTAFLNAEKIAFDSKKEYIYILRSNSTMRSEYSRKNLSGIILAKQTDELIKEKYSEYAEYSKINLAKVYIAHVRNISVLNTQDEMLLNNMNEGVSYLKNLNKNDCRLLKQSLHRGDSIQFSLIRLSMPLYKFYIRLKMTVFGR